MINWEEFGRSQLARTALNLSQLCRREASDLAFHRKAVAKKMTGPHSHRGGHWFDPSIAHQLRGYVDLGRDHCARHARGHTRRPGRPPVKVAHIRAIRCPDPGGTVVRSHVESGLTARLEPATIDGLVYASSMVILYAARHGSPVPRLARWLLGLGIAATLTANMAQGWSHGPVGAAVAAWPAVSLVGSYELLVWLIRTAGTVERGVSSEHPAAADGGHHGRNEFSSAAEKGRRTSQQACNDDTLRREDSGDNVNDEAVAAYQSVQAGNPLSERKLAQMFGRTSRRWARARISHARQVPLPAALQETPADSA